MPHLSLPATELPADAVELGRIADAWGIKGWMKLHPHSSQPDALVHAERWYLQAPVPPYDRRFEAFSGTVLLAVDEVKPHADTLVVRSPDIADRDAAEALRGARIFVSRADFPESTDPDEFYWVDLLGLRVVNREGVALGVVRDLVATGPTSVLCIEYTQAGSADGSQPPRQAERMIPFVSAYVDAVDKASGVITVDWQPDY